MTRVGVLISGSGTNLQALIDATRDDAFPAEIALVVSNKPGVKGLERAEGAGIPTRVIPHRDYDSREAFDAALVEALSEARVEWVALAGFMRVVTPTFLDAFPGRILNIHPALLPSFPGVRSQQQALEHGVRIAGATVHFVEAGTDTGPIVIQGAVPVLPHDDVAALSARILAVEHEIFPRALRWACEGRLHVAGRVIEVALESGESTWVWRDA